MERKEVECCESFELHENLLKIVRETMPEETELYDLENCLKCLEILQGFVSCLFCSKRKYVSVIWRAH